MRRLDRVQDLLPAVDVLAGARELVLVDARILPLALHARDAVRVAENQPSVLDRVVVAIESAHGRAGDAIPLGVVLAAVARAAEAAGRDRRRHRYFLSALPLDLLLLVVLHRSVWLNRAAEMRAAVRDDREARLPAELSVVADIRRPAGDLSCLRVEEERRHEPRPLGEVLERPEVDVGRALLAERGHDHEADRRDRDETADHGAEAERGRFEEAAAREALARLGLGHRRFAVVRGNRG